MEGGTEAFYRRQDCRLCKSDNIEEVLPLTPTALCDAYVRSDRVADEQPVYPLGLFLCRECGYVHLPYVVDPEMIYRDYIYVTTSSMGLASHFDRYAQAVLSRITPGPACLVVDLGSNDGTLLGFFRQAHCRVLGVDPANDIARQATNAGIPTLAAFFTVELARAIRQEHGQASVITVNNLLANIDDLDEVIRGVCLLLEEDGVFVVESSYLGDLVRNMVFDFIYHEHLSYFSIAPLAAYMKRFDLTLVDIEPVQTKGGSLRYYFRKVSAQVNSSDAVVELLEAERALGLDRPETYQQFAAKIAEARDRTRAYLDQYKERGQSIAGYGGSATSTTLIYHFGLQDYLDFIVDDNPSKHDTFSPGWHIPVLPSEVLYERKCDCVLILAWRYWQAIVERHRGYHEAGGRFAVPLPQFNEVGGD